MSNESDVPETHTPKPINVGAWLAKNLPRINPHEFGLRGSLTCQPGAISFQPPLFSRAALFNPESDNIEFAGAQVRMLTAHMAMSYLGEVACCSQPYVRIDGARQVTEEQLWDFAALLTDQNLRLALVSQTHTPNVLGTFQDLELVLFGPKGKMLGLIGQTNTIILSAAQCPFDEVDEFQAFLDQLDEWSSSNFPRAEKPATVPANYEIVTTNGGSYTTQRITGSYDPLVPTNYPEDLTAGFDACLASIQTGKGLPTTSGRLFLLQGPPGTGKTHWIRALATEISNGHADTASRARPQVWLVSAELLTQLSGPQFGQLLLTKAQQSGGAPIVLAVEDGDDLVTKRDGTSAEHKSAVAQLLNLGDGILGAALNLRIVLSINTPKAKLDPAITRPGRLAATLDFRALNLTQAKAAIPGIGAQLGLDEGQIARARDDLDCLASEVRGVVGPAYSLSLSEVYQIASGVKKGGASK